MDDKRKALYDALSGEYNLGSYEEFTEKLNDENKRKALYDAAGQDYNLGTYEEYSTKLGFEPNAIKEDNAAVDGSVPMFDDEPNASLGEPDAERGFGAGAREGWKGLKAGFQNLWGETANVFSGSSQDSINALNELNDMVRQGKDVAAETENAWTDAGREIRTGAMELLPGWMIKGWKDRVLARAEKEKVLDDIREALGEAGGDVDKARAILEQRAQEMSYGDEQIAKAAEKFADVKPTEGFGAWVGSNAVQMIPSASALIVGAVTKSPAAAKAIGMIGMGGMTAATAGTSMYEARQAGASDQKVWKVGITDGMIEYLTEKLPFDRYTSRIMGKVKGEVAQNLFSALRTNKATRTELENLLIKANDRLGGKLFSKKNLKDYLADMLAEGASEFSAEALQTMTSMMYENPEDYPTINEILTNGWEGAKAGFFMGAVLGGASKTMEHTQNRKRRMDKGSVDVALVDFGDGEKDVAEVVEYDASSNTAVVLHDGSFEKVSGDAIADGYRFSYEEFENARLRQMEDEAVVSGNVTEGQIQGLEDNIARDIEEIKALAPEMTESEISAILQSEMAVEPDTPLGAAVAKYQEDVARHDELVAAKREADAAKKEAIRTEIETAVGQRFWVQESGEDDGSGIVPVSETVEEVVYADGRVGYVVGSDDSGNLTMVFTDGTKGFSSRAEIVEKENSGEILSNTVMGLDDYLAIKMDIEDVTREETRMQEEHALSVEEMIANHPQGSVINVGTEESKVEVPIIAPPTKDGVIVQMPDGTTPMLTWEDVAHAEKKEITPKTDAQLNQSIVDEYRVAYTPAAPAASQPTQQKEEQVKRTSPANPLPLKADGSVDQTALWNKDPEGWAQWNDEKRQDGGADSLAYVTNAIAIEQAKMAELQTVRSQETDFDRRDALDAEIATAQERINRLVAIQQNYAHLVLQQNQLSASSERAPVVQAEPKPRERSVESEVARLYELGLSDEEVVANLDAKVTMAQKALDAQSKKAPKMGADENAYITNKREHQQKMQELQQELDFVTSAKQAVSDILAQQTQIPANSSVIAIEKDAEPQNAVEFAARELGLKDGGIKLQRQSFAEHTGYGPSEMKKFFGLFKSKQDGGLTIEQAGERLMELDRENNTGFFDQNDPNAGLNAILDAIGAVNTIGELRSYVARQRQVEAQREADAAYSAMMAEYEATYGETMEESAHYDEVMRSEILINGLSENEQLELNNIIFAEEISQNGTEEYQTEAPGVYGSETGSNATDVEPGAEGVYTGSSGVLQETQSDNSGRNAESQESQRRSEGEGSEQDALPSVPSGESAIAVESSLDEDMPDFINSASAYFPSEETRRKFSAMRARIKDWSQKLGVQVRIMETLDDVVNQSAREQILKGRKVYGYFDPATGEVAFYLPDFLSLDGHALTEEELLSEIDKTYIHEVVSHRGLRGLLGEEKYGELCDMVWDAMTEQQKAKFLNYPGVNGNTRTAADEFIAHFAENVDYNDNRTLWDKIVDFIKDFFNSVELPAGISNESLAELLRHSYRNLAKSAAPIDTNANQQAEGNSVLRAANGSLVGLHNISEDKLRKVLKQGGLANPSTAVVNISEYLLDEYGEISLIMPSSLVDASTGDNIGTYTGDAWTPTYPPISRKVDDRGWKIIKDRIRAAIGEESELYSDIVHGVDNYLDDNRSSKMEFVFLKEKGIEPEIAYKGADGFVGMRNLEAILGVQGLRDGLESYERYKNASPMAKRSFNMWLDAAGNKQSHRELKEQLKKEPKLADVLKLNEDVSFADFDSFTYNIFRKEQDAGKIDTYDTMGAAARYVDANNLRGEFEAWLELLMEQARAKEVFFAGYTRSGERIYKDNTLENVSRHMRLQGRTNAYDNHGLSATKSALLQRLTSLSQIRKNKARLQNESAYNKEYDALKDRLFSIISQLADMQEISSNQFMNVDYAESRLQEAITKRNPITHLNKEYGYDIDPAGEYADELNSFIKDVQQMPAKYFETKFERPVYLNEFAAAVMPTTTSEDIKQAVSEAGLPIFEYDSEVEGSRKEATLKATEGEGIRFRILGEKGAANLDKAEEATIRLDNLGVARQMEEAGKDAKAIKLATGWERGADNLWRYEVADDFDLAELENRLQENLNDGLSKTWGVLYPSDLGELTKAYPDFNVDIMVWVGEEFENTGVYSPATEGDETTFGRSASIEVKAKTVADIKDVLVHEIQHAIQEMEGFAEGGQARGLNDKLSAELDKRVATIKQLREEGRNEEADEFMQMSKGLAEAVINNDDDAYGNYKKLAGEVEARNAATRIGKSLQERRESLLSETEDVAREDQIILMENLGVNHMADGNGGVRLTSSNASIARFDKVNGTDVRGFIDFLKNDKEFVAGKPTVFHIANAGDLLGLFGIKGKFMVGQFTFSRTHTVNADHELGVKEWIDVINNLNNPIAITSYKGQPNQFRIYTYATINGRNICVGVNVSTKDGSIELANIISAYGRDIQNLLGNESVFLLYPSTIQELKQKISQVSTAHNSLLNATSSALSADKGSNNLEKNNIRFRMRIEEEDAMEFQESVLEEFKQEYRLPAPTTVVDVYDRDAVANALGYAPEKFTDAQYDFIMKGYQKGGVSLFDPETKRIAIFAKETLNESWKMYDSIFHENTHFLVAEHPDLLELGEWLWQNSEPLMRKTIKEHILANDTYKGYETDEMLSGYTGVIMATGKADVAYAKTPEELRKHWDLIFNAFGYGRKTEDNPRRRGTGNNTGRVESSGNRADASAEQKHNDAAKQELTAEERRVIGEYFPEFNKSEDVRMKVNSQGKDLTEGQKGFFANSKAVDKDGNLLVLYHGTPRAGFTEFKSGWFTTSKEDAISYSGDRKGRLFDPNEKYEPETLTAGDFRLGYMTFDSEEDRAAFLGRFPYANEVMSEREYEDARIGAEDEEYDALTARSKEFAEVWNAYREYERERFVDTPIADLIANPEAYTEEDLMRAMLEYDSNATFDSLDDMSAEERKDALVSALQNANEETEGGILDMVIPTRVPRNGEGIKHNDLGNRTYEVYANVENPYEIDANGRGSEFESGDIYKAVEEALADNQYDGVIIRNWRVGRYQQLGDVVVPKDGNQIKLTSNENPTKSHNVSFRTSLELDEEFGDAWRNQQNEDGRHSTQVANTKSTYEKIGRYLEDAGMKGASILDASSGLGLGTQALREMGFKVDDVEPFPSENREAPTFSSYADIDKQYDVVISNAVLNVIPDDWRADVLHQMADAVKEGGKMIINTRPASNIAQQGVEGKTRITLDSPSEILVKRGDRIAAYQKGFTSEELAEWIKSELGEGWRVEKATKKNSGISGEGTAVVIKEGDNVSFRVTGTPTDEVVANGLTLTPAQTAEVAANIFAALPEESRKKITEGLNGNVLGLKDAILQIPTSLASKESWDEEDRAMADVVAEEMTKMAGEMTRPFSAPEALWLLYNNLNKGNDLISQASRALVQRNLGFDEETLERQEEAKRGVSFRMVGDATANAKASMYNRGAVNVWTRLKESFVDMQASVEELVSAIEKATGKEAKGFENILLALNQQSSKGLAAMESYEQRFLMPMFDEIRKIMDKAYAGYDTVVRYVILKHGLERNKKLAQRDAKAHYQEIYDEMIAKVNSMDDSQKRTYLTNAQLQDADAKAKLATLKAADTSAFTEEEKNAHKRELAKAKEEVKKAKENLERAQKINSMSEQELKDELDKIFEKIENGTDSVYKELRKNDYSGISSMFYDQLGVNRKDYSTEEEYQAALMLAKNDRFSSLEEVETQAEGEVSSFEGRVDTKELWKRINAATKETLRQQYEANMISKDQYESLRNMFEYYVPLRGFKDNTAEDMYTYYRKPNSTGYTKPILGAEGRKTEAESPFGWIAAMAGSAIASNVKNEAKLALYYFVSNRPNNGIATLSRTWFVHTPGDVDANGKKIFKPAYPPFSEDLSSDAAKQAYEDWQEQMRELQKQGLAYEAGQRLNLGNAVVNISDANKPEHVVTVKVAGKDYTIVINGNPRAAQAINGELNIESTADDYSAIFGPVLRWMSSVNTSYNPEFWITNLMRDMAFTWMAVNTKEDPAYRKKFSKNYRKAFKVISLVAKNEKGTIGNSYIEDMYKDFVKYGGVTGYTQIKDSETWEKEIDNYLSSTSPESLKNGKMMRGMKTFFHAAHRFGESLEQVSRFAAFLTSREMGKTINEAIADAKEITVNFNRKGSGKMITLEESKYLTDKNGQPLSLPARWAAVGLSSIAPLGRRTIMFFNAAVQGLNSVYRLWKKNPKRLAGWTAAYFTIGVLNAVIHALLDDDDDYLDIPQYERRNSLMVGGNGAYLKWALPQEARAFYALGDLAVETVLGRNPHQNVVGEAMKIATEVLPVNPTEGWKAFVPSVAIPAVELMLNEDYKGAPIYNEQKWLSKEERERTAKWSSAYQGTGAMYKGIAQGLNYITGGDKHDAGKINLQPEKMEHIVQSAFGGTIRTADKFINTIWAMFDPEEDVTVRQTPFLNRILTINDERFKNVHVNEVFDYYKADADHALTLEKKYRKDRDQESLNELRRSDEYQWAKVYRKYKKALDNLKEKLKVAEGTAERKELMRQQDELKRRVIKEISEL